MAGGVGAAAGVLLGYLRGWVGPLAVAVAFLFVAVGMAKPVFLKAGFVASVVATALFAVGAQRTAATLKGLPGAEYAETVSVFSLEIAAFAGADVEPARQPVEALVVATAGVGLWSLAGAAVGVFVWLVGVYVVNSRYVGVRKALVGTVRDEGKRVLGEDGSLHTLTNGKGSVLFVDPAERYDVANVLLGESSVSLHYGSTVGMPSRETEVGNDTKGLYYDQISSVDHTGERLRIKSADGSTVRVVASEEPAELIEELGGKIQQYKSRRGTEDEKEDGTEKTATEPGPEPDEPRSASGGEEGPEHDAPPDEEPREGDEDNGLDVAGLGDIEEALGEKKGQDSETEIDADTDTGEKEKSGENGNDMGGRG